MTSPVPARRARSAMTRSPRSFARRSRRRRTMRRTGACGRWRKQPASRLRRSTASGRLSTSSLTAPRPSSSQPILCSSRRCAIYRRALPVAAGARAGSLRRALFHLGPRQWLVESLSLSRRCHRADDVYGRRLWTTATEVLHVHLRVRVRGAPHLLLRSGRRLEAGPSRHANQTLQSNLNRIY
jgi:hypothetical protein